MLGKIENQPQTPCSDCYFHHPISGELSRSACCHGSVLTMALSCYINHFQDKDGIERVWFINNDFLGELVMVGMGDNNSCVNLMEDGRCGIEVETGDKTKKPFACQEVTPEVSDFCAKKAGGRFSQHLIALDSIKESFRGVQE
jgi:hypothetical protein